MPAKTKSSTSDHHRQPGISNRPFDPTADFAEYIGGEPENRTGITQDHTRHPGEDIKPQDMFEHHKDGTWKKGSKTLHRPSPSLPTPDPNT